jgi:hypothetical protein
MIDLTKILQKIKKDQYTISEYYKILIKWKIIWIEQVLVP